jgi:hypothetical protein
LRCVVAVMTPSQVVGRHRRYEHGLCSPLAARSCGPWHPEDEPTRLEDSVLDELSVLPPNRLAVPRNGPG